MIESGFNKETIEQAVHTKWAGKSVHFAEITDSTNLWAKKYAAEGNGHGNLFAAELQTAGRGRLGRKWMAPAGSNITMSLLLRPDFAPQYAPMLTLVMGLSVAQAVKEMLGQKSADGESFAGAENFAEMGIKWPNDVVISGKKICGILTEMSLEGSSIREVVVGVGINVNLETVEEEIKEVATSLYLETGRKYDRNEMIHRVMERFEDNYEKFLQTLDLTGLMEDYNQLLINRGRQVRVLDPKEPFEGIAKGINGQGELLVQCEDGSCVAVGAGEVSVRGLYGYV